ncbi:MAG: 1-(5-phosphoribosyl)-5-[(5-phosphoribosylamino)methylideneamino]imidazole-4-carboxamide isomerase [Clostridia bacterium]|nr:1-(5-phosphoribosyl)-5-[(5-phosphoribosylamino)methylideneamino]imidazole-4-carboxamide isomerase [Clostridia bacterium]
MILYPAIDLLGGRAVRLFKGDYNQVTVYSEHPEEVGRDFAACGADHIHIVDLEGARDGGTPNLDTVLKIKAASGACCEIGGGIRSMEVIDRYLSAGMDRVILGTAACENEALLVEAVQKYGEKIVVGADLKDGYVATRGWLKQSEFTAEAFFERCVRLGIQNVICTDISRDGAMRGTNRELYRELNRRYHLNITASGGVSSMEDVLALNEMGLYAAIIGKAYYTGDIDLKKAVELTR